MCVSHPGASHTPSTEIHHDILFPVPLIVTTHLEAGRVPGEVRADSEDKLILDEASAASTGAAPVPCKQSKSAGKWVKGSSRVGFSLRLELG